MLIQNISIITENSLGQCYEALFHRCFHAWLQNGQKFDLRVFFSVDIRFKSLRITFKVVFVMNGWFFSCNFYPLYHIFQMSFNLLSSLKFRTRSLCNDTNPFAANIGGCLSEGMLPLWKLDPGNRTVQDFLILVLLTFLAR